MDYLPTKLRAFADIRKKLGSQPCGYDYFEQAADELERLRVENDELKRQLEAIEKDDSYRAHWLGTSGLRVRK